MEDWTAADMFSALAHPHRVSILRLLIAAGEDGLAAGRIANALGIAPSSLSHHLAAMETQGVIGHRRQQRSLFYSANLRAIRGLIGFLVDDCCGGNPQSCGFDAAMMGEA